MKNKEPNLKFLIAFSLFCFLIVIFVKTLKPSKVSKEITTEKIYAT